MSKGQPFKMEVTFTWPSDIHDDDALTAIRTKLLFAGATDATVKKVRDSFLDSVAASRGGNLSEAQASCILEHRNEKGFMEAVARAFSDGRKPTFNRLETIIMKGWREVIINGESFPGFWEWKPSAAGAFLNRVGYIGDDVANPTNIYIDARKALGLAPLPFVVRAFAPKKVGMQFSAKECVLELKTGEKKSLVVPRFSP